MTTDSDPSEGQFHESEHEDEAGEDEADEEVEEVNEIDEVDDSVREDMKRLEDTFPGISEKFRLVNRIGEGTVQLSASLKEHIFF